MAVPLWSSPDASNVQNAWSKYAVLSLDGSGLRVLSELLILRRLMQCIIRIEGKVESPFAETSADSPLIERNHIRDEFEKLEAGRTPRMREQSGDGSTQSRFLPCHYFDFVVGTSTGGLVALMLGELRMSVDTALDFYLGIVPQLYRLHYGSGLRKMLSVKRSDPRDKLYRIIDLLGKDPLSSDESRCKTVVCSFTEKDNGQVIPFLFRSYREPELDEADLTVSAIARAGCCHPYSFEPVKLGDYSYYDTGFIFTNPSSMIIDELHQFHPLGKPERSIKDRHSSPPKIEVNANSNIQRQEDVFPLVADDHIGYALDVHDQLPSVREVSFDGQEGSEVNIFGTVLEEQEQKANIDLLVSLGSGYDMSEKLNTGTSTRARLNRILRATSEPVHKEVYRRSKTDSQLFSYVRLNANLELPKSVIGYSSKNESRKLCREIEDGTEDFLSNPSVIQEIEETAEKLVSLRRQRCQTRAWEAFAFSWRYRCAQCRRENAAKGTDKPIETFQSAADLIDHFLRQHESRKVGSEFNEELQMLTKESRTNSDELRKGRRVRKVSP